MKADRVGPRTVTETMFLTIQRWNGVEFTSRHDRHQLQMPGPGTALVSRVDNPYACLLTPDIEQTDARIIRIRIRVSASLVFGSMTVLGRSQCLATPGYCSDTKSPNRRLGRSRKDKIRTSSKNCFDTMRIASRRFFKSFNSQSWSSFIEPLFSW